MSVSAPTFLDLFCGCGGFSLGMERAGFHCVAAIDFNKEAIATFRANFPELANERVRCEDLTLFRPEHLVKIIGSEKVDVIAGGPPCQGFSGARKVDGTNHGDRLKNDPRLQGIAGIDRRQVRGADKPVFLRGWCAIFYPFSGLDPDNSPDLDTTRFDTTLTRRSIVKRRKRSKCCGLTLALELGTSPWLN